jgi:hypothetical protein
MRMKKKLTALLLIGLVMFQSCGDSDSAPAKVLILGSMWTGQFYKVNTKTGALTTIFYATLDDQPVQNIRSIVYHPNQKMYYALLTRHSGAKLLSINPATKMATVINNNSVDSWYQLSNIIVAKDDSLFAVGDLNNGIDGFVKFGTNGTRANRDIVTEQDMCCGYGMIHFSKQKEIIVANGNNQDDAAIDFDIFDENGVYKSSTTFTTFVGFDRDYADDGEWLTIRSMASQSTSKLGTVYGIMLEYDEGRTHLVEIDFENESIKHIAILDFNGDYDYNSLTFVPGSVAGM